MRRDDTYDVIVVGGGAAGMMAAIMAAGSEKRVILIEKNEKLGKKLFITGKGRCNFTNSCETEDFFSQVVSNAKFLYSSVYGFTNHDVIAFFEAWGLRVKYERGGRLFPASDKSSDVIKVLEQTCKKRGVDIALNTRVTELLTETVNQVSAENTADTDDEYNKKNNSKLNKLSRVMGVRLSDNTEVFAKSVIIATGGLSYPSTGSTGDGYEFAKGLGHKIITPRAGLTGINTIEGYPAELSGLTLTNTAVYVTSESSKKKLYEGFGEVLFTHFGVSGPIVLSVSSLLGDRLMKERLILHMDIKPALSEKKLDERLLREIEANDKKSMLHIAQKLLPKSLVPVLLIECETDPDMRGLELSRDKRLQLVRKMKDITVTLTSLRDFNEAIITRGGVSVKDIDPSSMESKIISGLYFAGEVLDVDALTGGYNLQIAWSTGALAGRNA